MTVQEYHGEVDNIREHLKVIEVMIGDIKRMVLLIESVPIKVKKKVPWNADPKLKVMI